MSYKRYSLRRRKHRAPAPIPFRPLIFACLLAFGMLIMAFGVYAWTAPGQAPPGGNVAAPLNSGATSQTKSGSFISSATVGGGTVNASSSLCISGDCKTAWSQVGPTSTVPAGLIGFFASACPAGWTEYTALRGRYVVGTPSGGTVAATVGTALSNIEDRVHTHTGPSHSHTVNSHSHSISSDGGHTHTYSGTTSAGGSGVSKEDWPNVAVSHEDHSHTYSGTTSNDGAHTHGASTGASAPGTSSSGTGSTGSSTSTTPYIQLTACQKS